MTTYKTINFETTADLRDAINNDLANIAYPISATHRINGQGRIVDIKAPLTGNSLYVTMDFDSIGSKMFALKALFESRLLTLPDDIKDILMEAQTAFETNHRQLEQEKREAQRLAYEQKKQAEEEARQEAKYQATRTRVLKEFDNLLNKERTISSADEFYYCLGWIVRNCGAFTCTLPDYCLSDFQRQFGSDYEPHIVDHRAKTSGNNPMKWAESMKTSIKKSAQNMVPALLTKYLSKSGNAISDSDFIIELCSLYGFRFGKTQDIEKIRATIPTTYIVSFEEGYAE